MSFPRLRLVPLAAVAFFALAACKRTTKIDSLQITQVSTPPVPVALPTVIRPNDTVTIPDGIAVAFSVTAIAEGKPLQNQVLTLQAGNAVGIAAVGNDWTLWGQAFGTQACKVDGIDTNWDSIDALTFNITVSTQPPPSPTFDGGVPVDASSDAAVGDAATD